MSRTVNKGKTIKKRVHKELPSRKPSEMENYDLYVLTCTECHHAFPPHYFRGQIREFRMCEMCKKNNPEIYKYLEKYVYHPRRNKSWQPFQQRLDGIAQKCELLKTELTAYKRQYCDKPYSPNLDDDDVDARAAQLLQSLIERCESFELDLEACKPNKARQVEDIKNGKTKIEQ
ncbi:uncharacterized protein [Drosophila virilis]|uniref:XPA C-terminal domain-containing protein n=1 Tax=Drosophila virilis TaxID=7244 RepID=B4M6X2_DROVI|nr:uncharacterized protein LOC6633462 isoform X1 [Drosophila virilis]XP_032296638.1 uncharacterized protein LOC6633462 isoform X1 [Drosophila virilis]EDW62539.1 uncharacterized protein Dvir_GJ16873 [Drosophila virilis]